jgi:hypothetical protein
MLQFLRIFLKFTTLHHFYVRFTCDIGWNVVESLYFSKILQHPVPTGGFHAAERIKFLAATPNTMNPMVLVGPFLNPTVSHAAFQCPLLSAQPVIIFCGHSNTLQSNLVVIQ